MSDSFSFEQGTCIVVAWRGGKMAVAADSRAILDGNLYETAKLRIATPTVLIGVTGVAKIIRGGLVVWDAHESALARFGQLQGMITKSHLLTAAEGWLSELVEWVKKGAFLQHLATAEEIVTLQVFSLIAGESVVLITRLSQDAGGKKVTAPFFAKPPDDQCTKTIPWGSGGHFSGYPLTVQHSPARN